MSQRSFRVIDYSGEFSIIPIEIEGIKTYATVNPEFRPDEEGILQTDNYFVYLLHPYFGSIHFTMVLDDNNLWQYNLAPKFLHGEIIDSIIDVLTQSI